MSGSNRRDINSVSSEGSSGGLYEDDMRREASISESSEPGAVEIANGGNDPSLLGAAETAVLSIALTVASAAIDGASVESDCGSCVDSEGVSFEIISSSDNPNKKGLMEADWNSFRTDALNVSKSSRDMVSAFVIIGMIFDRGAIRRHMSMSRERLEAVRC